MKRNISQLIRLFYMLLIFVTTVGAASAALPDGFVYLDVVVPQLQVDLRYAGTHNFVGDKIDGYQSQRPIITRQAALALKKVQEDLQPFGLGLKVFDAYRPQRAVDHFVRWAKDIKDTRMKSEFYPHVNKEHLFRDDYIASKSGHSRGSTIDLTIVALGDKDGGELPMGTAFDFFGPESWPEHRNISPEQRAHRLLLQTIMKKYGFKSYAKEWWHFTLANEPYPDTYFDFPVR